MPKKLLTIVHGLCFLFILGERYLIAFMNVCLSIDLSIYPSVLLPVCPSMACVSSVPGQSTVSILSMNSSATRSAKRFMPSTLPSLWQAMLFRLSFSSSWSNMSPIPMALTSTLGSLISVHTNVNNESKALFFPLYKCQFSLWSYSPGVKHLHR